MKSRVLVALLCCCASLAGAQTTAPEHRTAPRAGVHNKTLAHRRASSTTKRIKTPAHRAASPAAVHTTIPASGRPEPVLCTDTNVDDLSDCGLVALGDGRYAAAKQAWELAAWQGDYLAALWLGQLYDAGKGVPKDDVQAYAWFDISATLHTRELEGEQSQETPALSTNQTEIAARDALAKKMTQSEIEKAQQLSRDWQKENPRA
jgi:hypothetical protein